MIQNTAVCTQESLKKLGFEIVLIFTLHPIQDTIFIGVFTR